MKKIHRVLKISTLSVLSLGVAFTALMGFAHTKPGKPLLAVMGTAMGRKPLTASDREAAVKAGASCPLGFGKHASPDEKEALRRSFAATHAGDDRAGGRPALGFQLDSTTRGDVNAWAAAHNLACKSPKSGADLDCSDIAADALPGGGPSTMTFQSIWFTFGAGDKLVAAVGIRQDNRAEPISSAFAHVTDQVTREAGPAARVQGDPSAIASALLYQASAEYRFKNYFAMTRATNMGPRGFVLTEEYRSLPDS